MPPLTMTLAPALELAFVAEDEVVELLLEPLLDVPAAAVVKVLAYVVP